MAKTSRKPDVEEWGKIAEKCLRKNKAVFDRLAEI
jgi:hypothetical protein